MAKLNYNPELEIGDRVICIKMDDEFSPVPMGTPGVVKTKNVVFGAKQYNVNWDNGSKLSLIDGYDRWVKEEEMLGRKEQRKQVEESVKVITKKDFLKENFFIENKELFKTFNHLLLHRFLKKLRESGVVNMMGAAPYMFMGSERIKHQHHYDDTNEAFDDVVSMADEVRDDLIRGAMEILENEDKEITQRSVSRVMELYARKMLLAYTKFAGGHLNH